MFNYSDFGYSNNGEGKTLKLMEILGQVPHSENVKVF